MWDRRDREEDSRRLARGEGVLELGHETPASTVLDAEADEILSMPAESPWPIALAAAVAGGFVMLLLAHYVTAAIFAGVAMLVLVAWHSEEPQAA